MEIVSAIITNSKGELLLQKKTLDYLRFPGMWVLFGGAAESGDMKKEIEREVMEELGVKLPLNHEFDLDLKLKNEPRKFHIFSSKLDDLSKLSIGEGAGIAFFGKEELSGLNIVPSSHEAIKSYLKSH